MTLIDLPPFVFALIAAVLFALGDQFQAQGLATMSSRTGTAIGITAAALCFWLVAPWALNIANFSHPAVFLFMLIGLIRPALSANLAVAAIHHLGPTLAGTLSAIAPLFGAALGILWLGEVLTWPVAVGTMGIVCAVAVLAGSGRRAAQSWPLWALALPIGAAAVRSLSHAVTKYGMLDIPDPYFAALIGFSVSAVLTMAAQGMRGGWNLTAGSIALGGRGARWFILSGAIFALAVLALNRALLTGDIVTVVPIIAAAPVFTMAFSVTIFHREKITPRTLAALALVLPSVVLIVIWG